MDRGEVYLYLYIRAFLTGLWSGKTRAAEIRCYSQNEMKTQTRSNAANQTDLSITYSNEGTRKQQPEREEKTGKKAT